MTLSVVLQCEGASSPEKTWDLPQKLLVPTPKQEYKALENDLHFCTPETGRFSFSNPFFWRSKRMLYPLSFGNNPLFPQASDFAVVAKDHKNGHGVITYRSFEPGDLLAVVAGEIVSDIRQHTLQISRRRHMYDPYFTGYLLHSCDPNVSLNMRKKTLTALKPIKANSYLYMDYAETEDVLFRQFACCCGSEKCRGWITGRNEQPHQIIIESHEHVHTH